METRKVIEELVREHLRKVRSITMEGLLRKQEEGAPEPTQQQEQPIGEREPVNVEQIKAEIDDAKRTILNELSTLIDTIGALPEDQKNAIKVEVEAFVNEIEAKLKELASRLAATAQVSGE